MTVTCQTYGARAGGAGFTVPRPMLTKRTVTALTTLTALTPSSRSILALAVITVSLATLTTLTALTPSSRSILALAVITVTDSMSKVPRVNHQARISIFMCSP